MSLGSQDVIGNLLLLRSHDYRLADSLFQPGKMPVFTSRINAKARAYPTAKARYGYLQRFCLSAQQEVIRLVSHPSI